MIESEKTQWIETKKRLPNNYTEVICTDGKFVYYAEYTSKESAFNKSGFILCRGIGITQPFDYYHEKNITHWQELPKPPKTE